MAFDDADYELLESIYSEFINLNSNILKMNEQLIIQNRILEMLVKVQAKDLDFEVIRE